MTSNCLAKTSVFNLKPSSSTETWLIFDIETDGLYENVSKIHCVVIYDVGRKQTFSYGPNDIGPALKHLDSADVLIGHNILFYDIPVIKKLWPNTFNKSFNSLQIIDTLICTRLIWPKEKLYDFDIEQHPQVPTNLRGSAGLKAWGYRLSDHKIEFKDFKEYSEEMLVYCQQDVQTTKTLFEYIERQTVSQASLRLEHDFATCIERQIRSGFPFDTDAALDLVDVLSGKKEALESELKVAFPPIEHVSWFTPKVNNKNRGYIKGVPFEKIVLEEFNPGSRQQIAERLHAKYGWRPSKVTDKGNPVLDDEVLDKLPYPEAKLLAEYMLVSKRLGQLKDGKNAWLKLVTPDGRIHGDVVTNGCITGRCSHRSPNLAQVPAAYSPYGKDCRNLFQSSDGWLLVGTDAKALELRCLAGYLSHWDDGEYASLVTDENIDIHVYNQEKFGVKTRDISKRLLYGVAYGAGNLKAGSIIDPDEKDELVLKQLGANAINSFLSGIPALKKLKNKLANTLAARGYLIGLDGRILFCRSDFKALNVLLQSAGAIIMKQVVIEIHKNMEAAGLVYGIDWEQNAMIHDEVEVSCRPDLVELVSQQCLAAYPAAGAFFGFGCPIEGDAKVGKTWTDTH